MLRECNDKPQTWKISSENHISNKRIVSGIYKELSKFVNKKINNSIKKMNKILEQQTLIKEDIRMANKHMARCSTSLVIQEMQIKTTVRYHSTSIRTAISKNQKSHQKYQVLIRIRSTAFFTHCW